MSIITLTHGNGGRLMRELITEIFAKHLHHTLLDIETDAALLPWQPSDGALVMTSDSFTVQPLEFPGGDIGTLCVHGITNDLAVSGAVPLYMSLNAIIEEGLAVARLERIITNLARAASRAGLRVMTGDTKVVARGEGGGLYLAATGVGLRPCNIELGLTQIRASDKILVSGPVGDHGAAVMLAREEFGLRAPLVSDMASVLPLTQALLPLSGLRFMRDPTRGGLATVLHDIQRVTGLGLRIQASAVPVREEVQTLCEILGYDPYYLACEGRVVAVVAAAQAEQALNLWRASDSGRDAAIIGEVVSSTPEVIVDTALGGQRILEELEDDPLPRIC